MAIIGIKGISIIEMTTAGHLFSLTAQLICLRRFIEHLFTTFYIYIQYIMCINIYLFIITNIITQNRHIAYYYCKNIQNIIVVQGDLIIKPNY